MRVRFVARRFGTKIKEILTAFGRGYEFLNADSPVTSIGSLEPSKLDNILHISLQRFILELLQLEVISHLQAEKSSQRNAGIA